MSRFARNTIVLAIAESTYGTDATPTGANAILCSKPQITPLNATNVPRDVVRGFMGGSEQLVGAMYAQCTFDVELVNGGTAGTAPAWGVLLKACGMAETIVAVTRVDYTPISTAFSSASIYWYDDGLQHKMLGSRGAVSFKKSAGGLPMMSFTFKGLYLAPSAVANPTPTLTGFKVPQVVNEANTQDLTFGATCLASGAPALTGGTPYPSQGVEWDLGNKIEHIPLLGGESVEQTDRAASCKFMVDLTPANEATFMAQVAAGTLTSVGLIHGTTAGLKSMVFLPNVQLINPTKQDINGKRMIAFDGRVVPVTGNDEVRLVLF